MSLYGQNFLINIKWEKLTANDQIDIFFYFYLKMSAPLLIRSDLRIHLKIVDISFENVLVFYSNISCFAEVQVTQVCLERCELAIPEIYKNVPVIATARLVNQTLLPAAFEWGKVKLLFSFL